MIHDWGSVQITLSQGDITQQRVDAIVNAANAALAGGGGVDGAIHRAGGPSLMEETARDYPDGCATGSAVATGAGNLPAKYVLHAVGPVWRDGEQGEDDQLRSAVSTCLQLAEHHQCRHIAFPAISTGVYRFPVDRAARVMLTTIIEAIHSFESLSEVRIVLFDKPAYDTFSAELASLKPNPPEVET